MTIHLTILLLWPLALALLGALLAPGRSAVAFALVGGASGGVRLLSAAVRGMQSGYLRYYAALLLVGLTGLGAYFLISA